MMTILQAQNEIVIDADISSIWTLITHINQLHKVNPGVKCKRKLISRVKPEPVKLITMGEEAKW